ncbi:unnamed protein product [Nezara viridula]|uniref:Uncharacterized protein n=1 Tax=Nezara viridula TaxID=85310 RepID=A0A9P0MWE6_NEZVI|nr:unnamed protein product [Nezara viridula]
MTEIYIVGALRCIGHSLQHEAIPRTLLGRPRPGLLCDGPPRAVLHPEGEGVRRPRNAML